MDLEQLRSVALRGCVERRDDSDLCSLSSNMQLFEALMIANGVVGYDKESLIRGRWLLRNGFGGSLMQSAGSCLPEYPETLPAFLVSLYSLCRCDVSGDFARRLGSSKGTLDVIFRQTASLAGELPVEASFWISGIVEMIMEISPTCEFPPSLTDAAVALLSSAVLMSGSLGSSEDRGYYLEAKGPTSKKIAAQVAHLKMVLIDTEQQQRDSLTQQYEQKVKAILQGEIVEGCHFAEQRLLSRFVSERERLFSSENDTRLKIYSTSMSQLESLVNNINHELGKLSEGGDLEDLAEFVFHELEASEATERSEITTTEAGWRNLMATTIAMKQQLVSECESASDNLLSEEATAREQTLLSFEAESPARSFKTHSEPLTPLNYNNSNNHSDYQLEVSPNEVNTNTGTINNEFEQPAGSSQNTPKMSECQPDDASGRLTKEPSDSVSQLEDSRESQIPKPSSPEPVDMKQPITAASQEKEDLSNSTNNLSDRLNEEVPTGTEEGLVLSNSQPVQRDSNTDPVIETNDGNKPECDDISDSRQRQSIEEHQQSLAVGTSPRTKEVGCDDRASDDSDKAADDSVPKVVGDDGNKMTSDDGHNMVNDDSNKVTSDDSIHNVASDEGDKVTSDERADDEVVSDNVHKAISDDRDKVVDDSVHKAASDEGDKVTSDESQKVADHEMVSDDKVANGVDEDISDDGNKVPSDDGQKIPDHEVVGDDKVVNDDHEDVSDAGNKVPSDDGSKVPSNDGSKVPSNESQKVADHEVCGDDKVANDVDEDISDDGNKVPSDDGQKIPDHEVVGDDKVVNDDHEDISDNGNKVPSDDGQKIADDDVHKEISGDDVRKAVRDVTTGVASDDGQEVVGDDGHKAISPNDNNEVSNVGHIDNDKLSSELEPSKQALASRDEEKADGSERANEDEQSVNELNDQKSEPGLISPPPITQQGKDVNANTENDDHHQPVCVLPRLQLLAAKSRFLENATQLDSVERYTRLDIELEQQIESSETLERHIIYRRLYNQSHQPPDLLQLESTKRFLFEIEHNNYQERYFREQITDLYLLGLRKTTELAGDTSEVGRTSLARTEKEGRVQIMTQDMELIEGIQREHIVACCYEELRQSLTDQTTTSLLVLIKIEENTRLEIEATAIALTEEIQRLHIAAYCDSELRETLKENEQQTNISTTINELLEEEEFGRFEVESQAVEHLEKIQRTHIITCCDVQLSKSLSDFDNNLNEKMCNRTRVLSQTIDGSSLIVEIEAPDIKDCISECLLVVGSEGTSISLNGNNLIDVVFEEPLISDSVLFDFCSDTKIVTVTGRIEGTSDGYCDEVMILPTPTPTPTPTPSPSPVHKVAEDHTRAVSQTLEPVGTLSLSIHLPEVKTTISECVVTIGSTEVMINRNDELLVRVEFIRPVVAESASIRFNQKTRLVKISAALDYESQQSGSRRTSQVIEGTKLVVRVHIPEVEHTISECNVELTPNNLVIVKGERELADIVFNKEIQCDTSTVRFKNKTKTLIISSQIASNSETATVDSVLKVPEAVPPEIDRHEDLGRLLKKPKSAELIRLWESGTRFIRMHHEPESAANGPVLAVLMYLPEVKQSVKECDVDITESRLAVLPAGKTASEPYAIVEFPLLVIPNTVTAKFGKKTQLLTVFVNLRTPQVERGQSIDVIDEYKHHETPCPDEPFDYDSDSLYDIEDYNFYESLYDDIPLYDIPIHHTFTHNNNQQSTTDVIDDYIEHGEPLNKPTKQLCDQLQKEFVSKIISKERMNYPREEGNNQQPT
eukprot:TRINITY_DN7869_c0_g1_i1.p1 TRINITY_DN7869_c0_g1~~TRINITY_DN7869_c0_g1_i1.p1  ORF type:complete len:1807 (+),score=440.15 TRINITY_DN7869_c0_g1_i1:117-5423(+)